MDVRIGTAGWSIPRASAPRFAGDGTHLQRYSSLLRCAEINSSFYRPHAITTYAKWRDGTPAGFQFAVKMPRSITHEAKLKDAREPLAAFLMQTDGLAEKRGPILVQLPPSLAFDATLVTPFLDLLRTMFNGTVVWEPRHATWFTPQANALLEKYRVARVAADPACADEGLLPGGWTPTVYFRLHGSPRKYWSRYDDRYLAELGAIINASRAQEAWCIFDNTASGAALENAWELNQLVGRNPREIDEATIDVH